VIEGSVCDYVLDVDEKLCTCPARLFKGIECKHLKEVSVMPIELEKIEKSVRRMPSFSDGVNNLFGGSFFSSDAVVGIHGLPHEGKSLWMIHEAFNLSSKSYNVLYIDTEGNVGEMILAWKEKLQKRFPLKGQIYFESRRSLESLCDFLGYKVAVVFHSAGGGEKKEKGKMEFRIIESAKESDLEKFVAEKKIDVIILDSFSAPIRNAFPDEQCHDAETRCYVVGKGLATYKDVNVGDCVLGYVNGVVKPVRVLDKIVYEYDGEMVELRGRSVSCLVTPEHRVLVMPRNVRVPETKIIDGEYILAKDVPKSGVMIRKASDYITGDYDKLSKEYLYGWYIAEGSCGDKIPSVYLSCNVKDLEKLEPLLNRLSIGFSKYERGKLVNIQIRGDAGRKLYDEVKIFGRGARNKWIPDSVIFSWSEKQLWSLLNGIVDGDGCRLLNGELKITTSSFKLVQSLIPLCARLGLSINYNVCKARESRIGQQVVHSGEYYVVTIRRKNSAWAYSRTRKYKGVVWCLRTESGNFLIERDRRVCFSGNCNFPSRASAMALIFGKLITVQEKYGCAVAVTAHSTLNPANPYQSVAEMRGGIVAHHYVKRLVYIDSRAAKKFANYRRLWLFRCEDKPKLGGVAAVEIRDDGIFDYENYMELLTDNELKAMASEE